MCPAAITVAKESIFTLASVELVECPEILRGALTGQDKIFNACDSDGVR